MSLPHPPVLGRVSSSWRRQLAVADWPRPGHAADGGRLGAFDVLAASVIGQGHLHRGIQRQDAYHFCAVGESAVVAIADGVSAKPLSAIGAEIAAAAAVQGFQSLSERPRADRAEDLADAVDSADVAVREMAFQLGVDPRELSTTLSIALVELPAPGGERGAVTVAAVGNSSVLGIAGDDIPAVLSGPGSGATPETFDRFLPGDRGAACIDRGFLYPGAALVLATDGLAEDLQASMAIRRWLWERLSSATAPLELAHALSYRRQGSVDDLTAVAVRVAAAR